AAGAGVGQPGGGPAGGEPMPDACVPEEGAAWDCITMVCGIGRWLSLISLSLRRPAAELPQRLA
ncbi:MAG TPA: hypothetical protein DEF51_35565, partial [Myxococcales bacterium]|nr:hypothetical protein [Myxococcales bacterium]